MDQSFLMMFDFISIGCGVYILYTLIKLQAYGRLFPNSLLIPNGKSPKDCNDPQGYITYLKPRLLILGIFVLLFGLLSLLNESMQFFSFAGTMIFVAVTFAVIAWYGVCSTKTFKRYW